ncbi:hypothetical protein JAO73_09530 [Hymenobacter sp. BT523]|uniref:hypothetical protein n=1 Tax=Hymenobacter sp. BT523 TaxID=2795725 RepID=UPI0018EBFF3E|nr:hypothetical protein [Hymenobacter sp. BT523]MBJ6109252.1 hypothetical protein [Hymenobacter sp. BT523]
MAWLLGFKQLLQPTLEIQMHNTYFIVPGALIPLPFFLLEASLVTGIRMALGRLNDRLVVIIFALLTVLLAGLLFWFAHSIH